jgi:FtsP/CotA-like multicopper oxidase with cupredoxin domain
MDVAVPSPRRLCFLVPIAVVLLLLAATGTAQTQRKYLGRGAVSAQDLSKLTSPAAVGTTAADQVCARYTPGSTVSDPPVLQSQNGTLEVTMGFYTVTDPQGLLRYCYVTNTNLEAPTLVVNPGDNLIIHFTNNMPALSALGASDNMASMKMTLANESAKANAVASPACNGSMGTNVTNIHFHGTNIAPVCGQDEVVNTLVQPGGSFDYNVTIPINEPPGLYWYHPHPHGISEGQVQGGATGALIVQGIQTVFPSLANFPTRILVVRDQSLPTAEANDNNIPAWDLSINYVPVTYPGYAPAVIETLPGEQELWRVANTAADTILNLQYVVNGTQQPMQVYAIDGYPLSSGSARTMTTLQMGPGARAEFVVTTPNASDTAQLITQYQNTGPDGDFDPARPIANVVSQSGAPAPAQMSSMDGSVSNTLYNSLATLTPAAHRNLYFSEVLQNLLDPNSPTNFYITEEGQSPALFTMGQQPNIVVHAGTVEDWTVENRAGEDHVFHIHQLHFQVMAIDGQPVNDPALRDNYDIPYWSGTGSYPSITVCMNFSDPNITGTFVYHCHILEHEDGGMMGEIQVLPPGSAATATVASSLSSFVPNQNVTLTANVVDASSGNSTPAGLVQFQLNGENVGNPVPLTGGVATLTTPVDGNAGSNSLTALYEGDTTYAEVTSPSIPITVSAFGLTSSGAAANVGAAAIATVNVSVATNYSSLIQLTCTLPSNLAESACFINPNSITGTGTVQLTVNTTPAHPDSSKLTNRPGWLMAGGGASVACVMFLVRPRGKGRNTALGILAIVAIAFTLIGCGGTAKTDPGTSKGTYMIVVAGVAGSGSSQYQTRVTVPITIQ